ncbi:MAG: cytochrome c [Candidatus Omnitrophica bacterium]|nr:cytochrome c [Candidatus Omnitrophota bacterium]
MNPSTENSSDINHLKDQDEHTNVSSLHAAILREHAEPKEGREPLSVWLVAFMGALLFWGGFYLQRYSGGYKPLVYDENSFGTSPVQAGPAPPVDLYAEGKRIFADTCSKCHQLNGLGLPGQYPPLAGSEWVRAAGPARVIRIVLDGLTGPIQVKGLDFNNQMVPWRDVFSDEQIAAALTYVRGQKEWGNNASPVAPDQVAGIREKTKNRPNIGPWTPGELLAIPDEEESPPGPGSNKSGP